MELDKLIEKVGIYNFFGIWFAGAAFLVYAPTTIMWIVHYNILSELQKFQESFSVVFIFLFSILAYLLGTIFQEIGKWMLDSFKNNFNIKKLSDVAFTKYDYNAIPNTFKLCHPVQYRKAEFSYQVNKLLKITKESDLDFDEILAHNKAKNKTKLFDKYHSYYGLSRGLFIGFITHLILLCFFLIFYEVNIVRVIACLIIDVLLMIIFYIRTYRYYLIWVQNVFIQSSLDKN